MQSVAARATSLGIEEGNVGKLLVEFVMESVLEKFCSDEQNILLTDTVVSIGDDNSEGKLLLPYEDMECVNKFKMLTREVSGFPGLTVVSS